EAGFQKTKNAPDFNPCYCPRDGATQPRRDSRPEGRVCFVPKGHCRTARASPRVNMSHICFCTPKGCGRNVAGKKSSRKWAGGLACANRICTIVTIRASANLAGL